MSFKDIFFQNSTNANLSYLKDELDNLKNRLDLTGGSYGFLMGQLTSVNERYLITSKKIFDLKAQMEALTLEVKDLKAALNALKQEKV